MTQKARTASLVSQPAKIGLFYEGQTIDSSSSFHIPDFHFYQGHKFHHRPRHRCCPILQLDSLASQQGERTEDADHLPPVDVSQHRHLGEGEVIMYNDMVGLGTTKGSLYTTSGCGLMGCRAVAEKNRGAILTHGGQNLGNNVLYPRQVPTRRVRPLRRRLYVGAYAAKYRTSN